MKSEWEVIIYLQTESKFQLSISVKYFFLPAFNIILMYSYTSLKTNIQYTKKYS